MAEEVKEAVKDLTKEAGVKAPAPKPAAKKKYRCITKCFFNEKIFNVDEVVEFSGEVKVPCHFIAD